MGKNRRQHNKNYKVHTEYILCRMYCMWTQKSYSTYDTNFFNNRIMQATCANTAQAGRTCPPPNMRHPAVTNIQTATPSTTGRFSLKERRLPTVNVAGVWSSKFNNSVLMHLLGQRSSSPNWAIGSVISLMRPRQNNHHFADGISSLTFAFENCCFTWSS